MDRFPPFREWRTVLVLLVLMLLLLVGRWAQVGHPPTAQGASGTLPTGMVVK